MEAHLASSAYLGRSRQTAATLRLMTCPRCGTQPIRWATWKAGTRWQWIRASHRTDIPAEW